MRQIFLDTETTGLSPESGDRIIEIGCIEMMNRRLTGEQRHYYLNPERSSSEDAVKVHGLSDEFLADKPRFAQVADELLEDLAGAEVIMHNAAFDVGFLNEELRRLARPVITSCVGKVTDSLLMARETFPGQSNSLDALCRRLEVDHKSRTLHGALLDAGLLAEVYIRMTRGQHALVIDGDDAVADGGTFVEVDLSVFELVVMRASDDEVAAHQDLLARLDVACAGTSVWRFALA